MENHFNNKTFDEQNIKADIGDEFVVMDTENGYFRRGTILVLTTIYENKTYGGFRKRGNSSMEEIGINWKYLWYAEHQEENLLNRIVKEK